MTDPYRTAPTRMNRRLFNRHVRWDAGIFYFICSEGGSKSTHLVPKDQIAFVTWTTVSSAPGTIDGIFTAHLAKGGQIDVRIIHTDVSEAELRYFHIDLGEAICRCFGKSFAERGEILQSMGIEI